MVSLQLFYPEDQVGELVRRAREVSNYGLTIDLHGFRRARIFGQLPDGRFHALLPVEWIG